MYFFLNRYRIRYLDRHCMLHIIVIRNELNDDKEIFKYQYLTKERDPPFVSAFQTSISEKKN